MNFLKKLPSSGKGILVMVVGAMIIMGAFDLIHIQWNYVVALLGLAVVLRGLQLAFKPE